MNCSLDTVIILAALLVAVVGLVWKLAAYRVRIERRLVICEQHLRLIVRTIRAEPSHIRKDDLYRQAFDDESG